MTATAAICRNTFAVIGSDSRVSDVCEAGDDLTKLALHPKLPLAMTAAGIKECVFRRKTVNVIDVLGAFVEQLDRVDSLAQVQSALTEFCEEDLVRTLGFGRSPRGEHAIYAIDIALVGASGVAEIGSIVAHLDRGWRRFDCTSDGALLSGPKAVDAYLCELRQKPSEFRLDGLDAPDDVALGLRERLAKCIDLDSDTIGFPIDIAIVEATGVRTVRYEQLPA